MQRVIVDSVEGLEPWIGRWDDLAVAAARPYAAPGWLLSWWEHLRPPRSELRVVLVAEGDALLGVAPFFLHRGRLGRRDARILAAGHSHRPDVLAAPQAADELAAALAAALAADRPSLMGFEGFDAGSRWPAAVLAAWPGRRRPARLDAPLMPTPTITLSPAGYEAWLASRSSRFRRNVRQAQQRLAEHGGRIELASGAAARGAAIEAFVRLHLQRWEARGGSALPAGPTSAMLHAAAARLPDERLRLWTVLVDGEIAAVEVYVAAGGEVAAWNGGWDERHARLQLPLLAQLAAIEDAAARGEARIDLGGGVSHHKQRFADRTGTAAVGSSVLVTPGPRALITRLELAPGRTRRKLRERVGRLPERQRQRLVAGMRLLRI
jgi:CelD/BcsL family acetyltransferase involved in cellulose biosynthesis